MSSTSAWLTTLIMSCGRTHLSLVANAIIPPEHVGACDIEMDSDLGWVPADVFQLQAGEEIPEFSTITIPALTILGIFLYFQRRHPRRNI